MSMLAAVVNKINEPEELELIELAILHRKTELAIKASREFTIGERVRYKNTNKSHEALAELRFIVKTITKSGFLVLEDAGNSTLMIQEPAYNIVSAG